MAKSAEASDNASEPAESEADSSEEEVAEEPEARPSCDDGTCSTCGSGMCPNGWYCDQSAKGGPACGWVPECVKKPSCACLKKTLGSDCKCEEREGGLHVTCN